MLPSQVACQRNQESNAGDDWHVSRPVAGTKAERAVEGEPSPGSLPTKDPSAALNRSHLRRCSELSHTKHSHFAERLCDAPIGTATPSDEESMSVHTADRTQSASPEKAASSPNSRAAVEQVERLSLKYDSCHSRGRSMLNDPSTTVSKRAASREHPPRTGCQPAQYHEHPPARQSSRISKPPARSQRRTIVDRQSLARVRSSDGAVCWSSPDLPSKFRTAERVDSGYCSLPSPQLTLHHLNTGHQNAVTTILPATIPQHAVPIPAPPSMDLKLRPADRKYPGLILQPDSSPISLEQLAAEIKGIYAGLVMVEAKCMSIDKAQSDDPKSQLGAEQWQALIALHRTLLYEHHDFLMVCCARDDDDLHHANVMQATQHPSATQALRGLATKYNMPARMWKHGIHAFLEVLRHRRPASQDYMLAFIYLAYQMMALLLETVPSFTDTWIECLGDLARYRMAIEEEKEAHATWGGVAARWYTLASDRHPAIGRLYHHLGILERPSLRKLCFYAKSLTCLIPFANATDSLRTLCAPITQDERSIESSSQSVEARIVTFYALNFSHGASAQSDGIGKNALELLSKQPLKIRELGAHLCITSISALFGFGNADSPLLKLYSAAIEQATHPTNSSTTETYDFSSLSSTTPNTAVLSSYRFLSDTFDLVVRRLHLLGSLRDCLPYVHIALVWLHSLHCVQTRLDVPLEDLPLDLERLNWQGLARLLNVLAMGHAVDEHILACARKGTFIVSECKATPARPLPEDDLVRGLVWGQFYFPQGWFDGQTEDDGRSIEDAYTHHSRAERVLWLGTYLALHTEYLHYDARNGLFDIAAPPTDSVMSGSAVSHVPEGARASFQDPGLSMVIVDEPTSGTSSSEGSEDGFAIVNKPRCAVSELSQPTNSAWTNVGPRSNSWSLTARKGKHSDVRPGNFRVAAEDVDMDNEPGGRNERGTYV